jgi:hypothetical protein
MRPALAARRSGDKDYTILKASFSRHRRCRRW